MSGLKTALLIVAFQTTYGADSLSRNFTGDNPVISLKTFEK